MSRYEQDTIKRQIQQLVELLARVLMRARADHDYTTGIEAVREAGKSLGPDRSLLDRLGPESAVALLRDADRARAYARICAAEAELLEGLGRGEEAEAMRTRAAQVEKAAGT